MHGQKELELEKRVALVSGGGRGIGRAIAQALAGAAARVVAVARLEEELAETRGMIENEEGEVLAFQADVTVREEVQKAVRAVEGRFLSVKDDLDRLIQQADAIQQQDQLVLRLHKDGVWA